LNSFRNSCRTLSDLYETRSFIRNLAILTLTSMFGGRAAKRAWNCSIARQDSSQSSICSAPAAASAFCRINMLAIMDFGLRFLDDWLPLRLYLLCLRSARER